MRFLRSHIILILVVLLASCDFSSNNTSASGILTSTPFQPQTENASDSPYSAAAPTPIYLPTITPLPPTPTEIVINPEALPADLSIPTSTSPTNLNPLTGLPPSDLSLLDRRPLAIK